MTTLRQIIKDAYREGGHLQIGSELDADELDEGFRKIKSLISSLFGNELGGQLVDLSIGDYGLTTQEAKDQDYLPYIDASYIPEDARLVCNLTSAETLYLPPNPVDGTRVAVIDERGSFATTPLTISANGRKIGGSSSVTLSTTSTNKSWFYRADLGDWVEVTDLLVTDESPFPSEFDELLVLLLAFRINPRHETQMSQESYQELMRLRRNFRARYKKLTFQPSERGLLALGLTRGSYLFDRGV